MTSQCQHCGLPRDGETPHTAESCVTELKRQLAVRDAELAEVKAERDRLAGLVEDAYREGWDDSISRRDYGGGGSAVDRDWQRSNAKAALDGKDGTK